MANYIISCIFAVENKTKTTYLPTFKKLKVMYKALLLNTKGEIEDYRICNEYENAVKQCIEWKLKHEYDLWETEIVKADNVTTITYSDKMKRTHNHKIIWKKKEL